MDHVDVLLIGGGAAATAAAAELRKQGFAGSVTLLTRELEPPYHRPMVSKELLGADGAARPVSLVPAEWWEEQDIVLRTRSSVQALDTAARTATLADGTRLGYSAALLATGANVRRLAVPGAALAGIHYLRAPANAAKLRADAAGARTAVLVGGSFIAVEVAAALTEQGLRCTMIMQERAPLENAFGPAVADHVADQLTRRGVRLVRGDQVTEFGGEGRVTSVRTGSAHVEPADLVVVGVGAVPETRLAVKAGLTLGASGGVLCDAFLRTSAPGVFAAGDVCEYESQLHGRPIRVEHEEHAAAQGVTAANGLLGSPKPHREVPYFWTELADWLRLEYVGPALAWDRERVTGSFESGSFTVWYERDGAVVGALTSNRRADLDIARTAIGSGSSSR